MTHRTLLLALLLASCTPAIATREACYAQADVRASQRASIECDGRDWQACPAREPILSELRASYRGCP